MKNTLQRIRILYNITPTELNPALNYQICIIVFCVLIISLSFGNIK